MGILLAGDLVLQAFIVVLGLVLFFNPHTLTGPIHLGTAPTWSGLVFAVTVAVISFTSLESASGLAGEVRISRAGLKRLVASTTATVAFLYVGIALVAVDGAARARRPHGTLDALPERADDRRREPRAPALARARR